MRWRVTAISAARRKPAAISQPALSMQIKEMEQALGGALLERSARQVALTTFGEELLQRVRDILRSVDELGDFARASQDRLAGRLRVGMIPTIAPYLLPKVIENLARLHPELDIHVRETLTPKLIKEVAEGRLDTAIVALPVSEPSLTEVALFTENFLLVRPGEDEGTPVPSREMLREMRLLLLEEGHCFRDQALSFCNMQSSPPREVLDASSLSTLVQMVGAGIGVTLIPEMAVAVETRSAPVSVARFQQSAALAHHRHGLAQDQPAGAATAADLRSGVPLGRQDARAERGHRSARPAKLRVTPMPEPIIRPARADEYDEVGRVWMESWVSTGLERPAISCSPICAPASARRSRTAGASMSPTTTARSPPCWRCICRSVISTSCSSRPNIRAVRSAASCLPSRERNCPTKSGCAACARTRRPGAGTSAKVLCSRRKRSSR